MTSKKNVVTIPDYEQVDANDIRDELIRELRETRNEVDSKIHELANGDKDEIERITRSSRKLIYQVSAREGLNIDIKGFSEQLPDDKEPTVSESLLSAALLQCDFCIHALSEFDFIEATKAFAYANRILGMENGRDRTESLNKIKQTFIQQMAAQKRHSESRASKAFAIQYYKDNHSSFENKDDAAHKISGTVVLEKFSTVRGWLKGVNPESS